MGFLNPEDVVKKLSLEEGMSVADFGAGTGAFAIPIAKRIGERGRVYAIDVNQELLLLIKTEATRVKLSNIDVIRGDVETLGGTKLIDGAVGLVVLSNILFQTENKEAVLREAKRILLPRGSVLAMDWQESFGGAGPKPEAVINKEAVKKLFLNSGFALYNEIEAGEYHYALLFKRL